MKKNIKKIILEYLNQKNCFDFDYQPYQDDFLAIKSKKNAPYNFYNFCFKNGKWIIDGRTPFDRTQHEFLKNGKINESIDELFGAQAREKLARVSWMLNLCLNKKPKFLGEQIVVE